MRSFVVMQPPEKARSGLAGLPIVVRDGFSLAGLILGPLWLAWHRLWLAAIVALAVMVGLNVIGLRLGVEGPASWVSMLVSLWIGLEGSALRLAGLRRRGFVDIGVVQAANRDEAELRFAAGLRDDAPAPRSAPLPAIRVPLDRPPVGPAIGMVKFQSRP